MQVEFQISWEEYLEFNKIQLKERFLKQLPIIGVLLFIATFIAYTDYFNWTKTAAYVAAYILLIAVLFYFLPVWAFKRKLKTLLATDKEYTERRRWIIEEDGLRSEGTSKSVLRIWESFALAKGYEKFICLTLTDKRFMIVSRASFASNAEATNFLAIIQSKILKSRGNSNLIFKQPRSFYAKPKPPYWIGIFCLIPVAGAALGLVLILYGILKYKDKWLILIGAAGVVITITFTCLTGTIEHFFAADKGFVELDKMTLNSLVKEIEFYKIQHGSYPDSLQQLDTKNQLINTFDPLSSGKRNTNFNYYRIKNRYILFSSGIDQIAGTRDDIYPPLAVDTNKIGLIIPNK